MAICAREGLGISNKDGAFNATSESRAGGSISWDAIVVDGGSGWIRSKPSDTRVDTLRIGGCLVQLGVGLAKRAFLLQQFVE